MAVIVHHQRVAQLLGLQAGALRPERPQTDGDVEEAVLVGADRRQGRGNVLDGQTGFGHGPLHGAAAKPRQPAQHCQSSIQSHASPREIARGWQDDGVRARGRYIGCAAFTKRG